MKKEALRHPKMLDLASRLEIGRDQAIGKMTLLWDFVQDYAPRGDIGRLPDGAIAMACEWSGDPKPLIDAMVDAGWLERNAEHRIIVHDWPDHCERWVHAKLAKLEQSFLECYRHKVPSPEPTVEGSTEGSPVAEPLAEPNLKPKARKAGRSAVAANGACASGIKTEELGDTPRLLDWFKRACRRKKPPVCDCDADRLRWVGAAERALEIGDNPAALFTSITNKRQWDLITIDQEDRARGRLKLFDQAARPPPAELAAILEPFLSQTKPQI